MAPPKSLLENERQQRKRLKIIQTFEIFIGFISLSIKSPEKLTEISRTFQHTVGDEEDEGLLEVERCVGDILSNANNRACVPERLWPWA